MVTKFESRECVIYVQSTKIGTNHSILCSLATIRPNAKLR